MHRAPALPALLVLALLLAAPPARGQVPSDEEGLRLDVGAFPAPVPPESGTATAPVAVDVSCAIFEGVPPRVRVALEIPVSPTWARVEVVPSAHEADPTTCVGGRATFESELRVQVSPGAEAFQRGHVLVSAAALDPRGIGASAEDETEVQAGFVGVVHARALEINVEAGPGDEVRFWAVFENMANGDAVARLSLDEDGQEVAVAFSSEAMVGVGRRAEVDLLVRAPGDLWRDGPHSLNLTYEAVSSFDPSVVASRGTLMFSLYNTTLADPPGEGSRRESPAPPAALSAALAAVAVALLARRAAPPGRP